MSDNKKQNKPNVPNLRFPEFSGEWKSTNIGQMGTVIGGGTPDTNNRDYWNGGIQWFTPSEVGKEKYVSNSIRTITQKGLRNSSARLLPAKSILLTSRATIGECSINIQECCTNQGFQSIVPNTKTVCPEFLYYRILTHKRDFIKKACGSTFLEISAKQVAKQRSLLPSKTEQINIATILQLLDERISVQNKVIEKYESLIKALTQEAHKRATSSYFLRDVLAERKELNSKGYDICSVSVSKGVINQIEYLGRSFAAKETKHYHVVRHGDVVYTKSPTGDFPYGIIKQNYNDNPAAVSPLYGVYEPITYEVGVYLHYYFCSPNNALNYLHPLIQKGAKNTINITNQHFLDNKVRIPDSKVLSKTVSTIITISSRLQLEERVLYQLQLQKQFLLSNMFI